MNLNIKGFTLIELLVVIAIIGMLSSVVLSSLNTARGKAANAAVKSNLNNMRAQAEIYYDGNIVSGVNSYAGFCGSTQALKALSAAQTAAGASSTFCNSVTATWVASVALKSAEGTFNYWCVDSSGSSKGHPSVLTGSPTACP